MHFPNNNILFKYTVIFPDWYFILKPFTDSL